MSRLTIAPVSDDVVDEGAPPAAAAGGGAADIVDESAAAPENKVELPRQVRRNEDGSLTLPLRQAIAIQIRDSNGAVRQETVDSLTFRPLNGAALLKIQETKASRQTIVSLALAAGISEPRAQRVFNEMLLSDVKAASACMEFLNE